MKVYAIGDHTGWEVTPVTVERFHWDYTNGTLEALKKDGLKIQILKESSNSFCPNAAFRKWKDASNFRKKCFPASPSTMKILLA